ncbi:putative flippase GtrA [Haloferula luteola]|uniref:Putative flippase GtrA n=1 Tax=Haloferula luteola TaxID=595692 RepID=A0A840V0E0_9BACT|nr:GtrA family protein [Haloferula luteola]MBB5350763.1 putative flippase GtrA [Haloferula luteola]
MPVTSTPLELLKSWIGPMVRFGIVGAFATAVHYGSAMAAVSSGIDPLASNAVGFAVGFSVGFSGHFGWSFREQRAGLTRSLTRYAVVAALGFALNHGLFTLAVRHGLPTAPSLACVLGIVAANSFLLSKVWAFRRDRRQPDPA